MGSDITPFKGQTAAPITPTTLLRRFKKPAHIAEIRERTVTTLKAIEFIVFVDGSLLESQMFHGHRLKEYAPAIEIRAKLFTDDGWLEQAIEALIP